MKHNKTYHSKEVRTINGPLHIEGPITTDLLSSLDFHEDLTAFRPAKLQHKALIEISKLPEGRIIIARNDNQIVGYVTFLYPHPLERWSHGKMKDLIELGAIEVIPFFRASGVGKSLLSVSMMDEAMDNYIIISTEYHWHWDLQGTNLTIWQYRKMMEKLMHHGGLRLCETDDPEITSHPANCLMVRVGKKVPRESLQQFHRLRFMHQYSKDLN